MTETTAKTAPPLPAAIERFVVHWGEMGEVWGVNRSVAQIHALLYVSDRPLTAEEIAERLKLARSNISNSLRELMTWTLVKRVSILGDRRDYYEAEADMFEMVRRIASARKAREIEPAIAVLRTCVDEAASDANVSPAIRRRFQSMLEFTEGANRSVDEILKLPTPVLSKLLKMGGAVARLAKLAGGAKPAKRS